MTLAGRVYKRGMATGLVVYAICLALAFTGHPAPVYISATIAVTLGLWTVAGVVHALMTSREG